MDSTKKKFAVTTTTLPNTQKTNRNDIFNSDQETQIIDEDAAKRMNELMEIVIENNEVDQSSEQEEEKEEEEFTFRLFSTGSTTKVSLRETNEKEQMDYLAQQIANNQELEFDEKDPELLEKVNQAVMNYDDILKQSTWPYPALRLPKRVITISSSTTTTTKEEDKSIKKKKRKSKKRRDFEKAVKTGRIQLDPNMRNPLIHGPGWPYSKTPCAIINYQPSFKKSNYKGQMNNSKNSNMKSQHRPSSSSFRSNDRGKGKGRGGHTRGGGSGRGARGGGTFRGKITKVAS